MAAKSQVVGTVVAGFPSPAEQYTEPPLDLNELLVKRPAATFFVNPTFHVRHDGEFFSWCNAA